MCRRLEQSKPIQSHEKSDEALSSFPFDDDEEKMNFSTFYHFLRIRDTWTTRSGRVRRRLYLERQRFNFNMDENR